MLKLLNKDRKMNGLKKLRMQQDLREVARKHSKDMARKSYFEHENILGQTPFDRLDKARITDIVAGENLAKIKGFKNPVVRAEIGLMNSPGHRANILNEHYNAVGIGIIKSIDQIYYYTQNFAARDLIFLNKIPNRVRLHKGLKLKGFTFTDINKIFYRIKKSLESEQILQEGFIGLEKNKFNHTINFKDIGIFYILIYVGSNKLKDQLKIANKFEIKVSKGWFW